MFLFFSMLLITMRIKRIISSEKWFNYVVTFFFFENDKNLGQSDDVKREKKRGWPNRQILITVFIPRLIFPST